MASIAVVENLNVFKNVSLSLHSRSIMTMMNQLGFQRAEETFHGGIVVTIALAAHTRLDLIFGQDIAIVLAGVLAAPIRVMQQVRFRLASIQRHSQGGQDQRSFQARRHGPADNPTGPTANPELRPDTTSLQRLE